MIIGNAVEGLGLHLHWDVCRYSAKYRNCPLTGGSRRNSWCLAKPLSSRVSNTIIYITADPKRSLEQRNIYKCISFSLALAFNFGIPCG